MDRINGAGHVNHLFVAENVATNQPPTEVTADWLNMIQEELAAFPIYLGKALDPNNKQQVLQTVLALIEAKAGNYALDTGAANAYVMALNPAIATYADGMTVSIKIVNANTAASTLNAGGGAVALANDVGGALVTGDLPAGCVIEAEYIASANKFYITSVVQSQADTRYLQQFNTTVGLVETFGTPGGAMNRRYNDIVTLTGMNYNGAVINAEYGILNNTGWSGVAFAGRDITGPCFAEVMTDSGQKLFYYAVTAAAGVVPTWNLLFSLDMSSGVVLGVEKAGMVAHFAMSTAPAGWLKANGAAISVASYSALASAIYMGDVLNATALSGYKCTDPANPTTTRNITGTYIVLPDLRGEFLRGFDDARGVDTGRAIGSAQADDLRPHSHPISTYSGGTGTLWFPTAGYQNVMLSSNTGNTGGTETRPRNIALLACIKY